MSVIPANWEVKMGGSHFEASPVEKSARLMSINKPDLVVCTCNSTYAGGIDRRIMV
jgi:hypothetical protein